MVKQVLSQFTILCQKMIEAKGLSPNHGFLGTFDEKQAVHENSTKVETLVEYLKAQYLDEAASAKLVEEGYSSTMANQLSTLIRLASQKKVFLPHSNM
jgi:hypothetical protein